MHWREKVWGSVSWGKFVQGFLFFEFSSISWGLFASILPLHFTPDIFRSSAPAGKEKRNESFWGKIKNSSRKAPAQFSPTFFALWGRPENQKAFTEAFHPTFILKKVAEYRKSPSDIVKKKNLWPLLLNFLAEARMTIFWAQAVVWKTCNTCCPSLIWGRFP